MSIRRLALVSVLLMGSPLAFAGSSRPLTDDPFIKVPLSIGKTAHSGFCLYGLGKSYQQKHDLVFEVLGGNFDKIREHHSNLLGESDEQYGDRMRSEIQKVAFCHPVASSLIGKIPGTDVIGEVFDPVTKIPSSVDRKITYTIWAYDFMLRSASDYVDQLKAARASRAPAPAAPRILSRVSGLLPGRRQVVEGGIPAVPSLPTIPWPRPAAVTPDTAPLPPTSQAEVPTPTPRSAPASPPASATVPAPGIGPSAVTSQGTSDSDSSRQAEVPAVPDPIPQPNIAPEDGEVQAAEGLVDKLRRLTPQQIVAGGGGRAYADWLREQGVEDVPEDIEDLRPTVSVYALKGRKLVMYEVQTVHLLFPSSTGSGKYCYERYNPDFPKFARLFNAGRAEQQAEAVLSEQEASELLKFFNSAAGVNANSFILSDLAAVAISEGDAGNGNALANCVRLAQQEAFGDEEDSLRWERGSVVHFAEDDKTWQTLMMMLAAKRIEVAQESVAD